MRDTPFYRNTVQVIISLTLIGMVACTSKPEEVQSPVNTANEQPNIVLIITDDQGWGDLSLNGNPNLSTPHIDQLAAEGISFEHFYVQPVCSPTRAELLTGRYYPRGGVYSTSAGGERLDLDETTFAKHFQQAGYQTACYGKWHNGMQYPYHPNGRGFDDFYGFASGHWGYYFSPMLERNGQIVQGEGYLPDDLTDKSIEFIRQNQDKPFLLYLPFNTPHGPMQVPDEYWNPMQGKPLDLLHRDTDKEDLTFTRAALAMCENIDWNVGRITQTLEELELEENTIVIYMTDNGPNSWRWNGGMKGRKGHTDEGGVRSPLIMQWKGTLEAGKEVEKVAGVVDIFPTLADLAGVATPQDKPLDGRSLKPLLMGKGSSWPERTLISYWRGNTSARSQQYRLDHEGQLFDMEADPGQYIDLADAQPEVLAQLVAAKESFEQGALAELPEEDNRPFIVGHPDYPYYQLPARDAVASGVITRSSRWPNCSFFENWASTTDSISWEIEVPDVGEYEVDVYYTCKPKDVGVVMQLSFLSMEQIFTVAQAHDPPLKGKAENRIPADESQVKDFKPLNIGTIRLPAGKGTLTLKALEIPGEEAIDFRLLMLKRVDP